MRMVTGPSYVTIVIRPRACRRRLAVVLNSDARGDNEEDFRERIVTPILPKFSIATKLVLFAMHVRVDHEADGLVGDFADRGDDTLR